MFRPRLFHIKTEDELFKYFSKNAGYIEKYDTYQCAGIYANDTRKLFLKLIEEWKKDIEDHKDQVVESTIRELSCV